MTVVATLSAVLSLDDAGFRRDMRKDKKELGGMRDRLRNVGGQVRDMGAGMTAAMAPVAGALGVAVNTTRQFDRNMSNVNAILGQSGDEAANLRDQILDYGGSTVAGPMETSEAFYSIVSGVQDASTHMAILDAATRTAEAGQANLQGTTSGMISTMNAYGFAADDAAYVSDVFTRTVQTGVLTMDEMASALPQVTGLASKFNVGIDEVGGNLAYLTTQGYAASESATFLKSMMTTLLAPTTDMQEAIQGLGYESGQALLEAEGIAGAYGLLAEQNGGLAGLVTNQEALQGAIALTNDQASEFMETYVSGVEGATERAGAIQDETAGWSRLNSQLQEVAIQTGSVLAPILTDLVENRISPVITGVSEWMRENPELTKQIILMTGAAVLLGPAIWAVGAAVGVLTSLMSPLGIALAAGTLLVLGYKNNWLGFRDVVDNRIAPVVNDIIEDFSRWNGIIRDIDEIIQGVKSGRWDIGDVFREFGQSTIEELRPNSMGDVAQGVNSGIATLTNPNHWVNSVLGRLGIGPSRGGLAQMIAEREVSAAGNVQNFLNPNQFKARGGAVMGGTPYMVGEEGPELFVPRGSGSIMNNRDTQQMMGQRVSIQIGSINANSYEEGRAAARGLTDELREQMRGTGVQMGGV